MLQEDELTVTRYCFVSDAAGVQRVRSYSSVYTVNPPDPIERRVLDFVVRCMKEAKLRVENDFEDVMEHVLSKIGNDDPIALNTRGCRESGADGERGIKTNIVIEGESEC